MGRDDIGEVLGDCVGEEQRLGEGLVLGGGRGESIVRGTGGMGETYGGGTFEMALR